MERDVRKALAPRTLKQYDTIWEQFKEFAQQHGKQYLPATPHTVGLYITNLHHESNIKGRTIKSYLSAIAYYHRLEEYRDPTDSYLADSLLRSYAKSDASEEPRRAISSDLLTRIVSSINNVEQGYEKSLFKAILVFMYQGLLRSNEVSFCKEAPHILLANQVSLKSVSGVTHVCLAFKSFKHSKPNPPPLYLKPCAGNKGICPVTQYKQFVKRRMEKSKYLFCWEDGSPLNRLDIAEVMKRHLNILGYPEEEYNTHSFRIGKTTDMAKEGYSHAQIAMAGRWASNAYQKYIKPDLIIA